MVWIEMINGSIKSIETPKEKDYYILSKLSLHF